MLKYVERSLVRVEDGIHTPVSSMHMHLAGRVSIGATYKYMMYVYAKNEKKIIKSVLLP